MAVLRAGQAVDDLVDGTVASAGDHQLAPLASGTASDFDSFAGRGCFCKLRLDASGAQDSTSFVKLSAAGRAPSARVRVVNQQSVAQIQHGLKRILSRVVHRARAVGAIPRCSQPRRPNPPILYNTGRGAVS